MSTGEEEPTQDAYVQLRPTGKVHHVAVAEPWTQGRRRPVPGHTQVTTACGFSIVVGPLGHVHETTDGPATCTRCLQRLPGRSPAPPLLLDAHVRAWEEHVQGVVVRAACGTGRAASPQDRHDVAAWVARERRIMLEAYRR